MKITVENIAEMFEGTKELLIGGLITAVTGLIIIIGPNGNEYVKVPLMFVAIFLITIIPGFIAMLFSPLTKLTAKIFDIKSSNILCRLFSFLYFLLYWFVTLSVFNFIIRYVLNVHPIEDGMKICFAIGCFIVAVVQTRRFYTILIK
ncbi:hypothetical protein K9J15_19200 [Enterobacter cloacae]|uniref:hypothetical protein n=1 Tax=Enterobacter cloacae TaxID=550 RepID=UPI001FF52127|nr:hypothetical protein [Enterobacter cloacae]MCK1073300.1 hypothetical protein [Enterobacter cloacae subsp. cloacae]MCZ9581945.1 hypothetical protein [Enterobacter cloacae]HAS1225351.1 hypothetical protein [Enterobacter cloacae]HDC4470584.1 hypothetical protein [Enterobacter kobei]